MSSERERMLREAVLEAGAWQHYCYQEFEAGRATEREYLLALKGSCEARASYHIATGSSRQFKAVKAQLASIERQLARIEAETPCGRCGEAMPTDDRAEISGGVVVHQECLISLDEVA